MVRILLQRLTIAFGNLVYFLVYLSEEIDEGLIRSDVVEPHKHLGDV